MTEETSRKRKQPSNDPPATDLRPSYTMKLFDRSIDLAKFSENTPLYPICRAWIKSNHQNAESESPSEELAPEREEMPDLLENYLSGAIKEIAELPKPKEPSDDVPIKAPVLDSQKPNDPDMTDALDKHMKFLDTPIDRKTLLKENLCRWKLVKKSCLDHARQLDERFEPSLKVIKALYKA